MTGTRAPSAVIGVGYRGNCHAEKYAASSKAELVAVVDTDEQRACEIGNTLGVPALTDYRELFGRVKCASIAVWSAKPSWWPLVSIARGSAPSWALT